MLQKSNKLTTNKSPHTEMIESDEETKAQGAIEYLMSYGWVIVVIFIIGATLWYLGIFSGGPGPIPTTTGFKRVKPLEPSIKVTSNGNFSAVFVNAVGYSITIENITIINREGAVQKKCKVTSTVGLIHAGKEFRVKAEECCSKEHTSGESYTLDVIINYTSDVAGLPVERIERASIMGLYEPSEITNATTTTTSTTSTSTTSTTTTSTSTTTTSTSTTSTTTTSTTTTIPLIIVGSGSGGPGTELNIPVYTNNIKPFFSIGLTIDYNSSVVIVTDAARGDLIQGLGMYVDNWDNVAGWVKVSWASATPASGSGNIAVITFSLVGNAGDSTILDLKDITLDEKPADSQDGTITIS